MKRLLAKILNWWDAMFLAEHATHADLMAMKNDKPR